MSKSAVGAAGAATQDWLCLLDSINYATFAHRGRVILSGSHGGAYSASKGMGVGPRGLVFNDAGGGLDGAGLAALDRGEHSDIAVATIAHDSARIGDAQDMIRRGVISHANAQAQAAGVVVGMACAPALHCLAGCKPVPLTLPTVQEYRREFQPAPNFAPVICIDSASLVQPSDAGRVVITGSHGGLIGGDASRAINVDCTFVAFNDAGVGCDRAGLGRLAPLDQRGIAAVTVSHMTARIGDAMSSIATGILSHVNRTAMALGAVPGMPLRQFLAQWPASTIVRHVHSSTPG